MTIDEAIKHCIENAEEREYVSRIIVELGHEESEKEHKDACDACAADHRQLAEWLKELKEARKLLTATKYKVKHEEWDMHGEHYIGDYALCPNCEKALATIHNGKVEPACTHCRDCGQKIDWNE